MNQTSCAKWIDDPLFGAPNSHYVGNRAPLISNAFAKLPTKAIRSKGWVRTQLELEASGFIGNLTSISKFLNKQNNAWLAKDGKGDHGWEEVPYWLKGFSELGYLLNDKRILDESKIWIDGVMASQRPSGYFGPESNLTAHDGRADIWPNMVMLDVLKGYFEYSEDARVLTMLDKYFRWVMNIPDENMFPSYWEKHRGGDMMHAVLWLYNRTGEPYLLELCHKINRVGANWIARVANLHGVNFAQAFREPATYYLVTKDKRHLDATERNYREIRARFGEVPGGLWGADENSRQGFTDPRQAAETCTMAEMMLSCERLYFQTGRSDWAERCEDVAFNSLPASMTPDLKALRYLTSPNMVTSDRNSKAPGLQNSGPMTLFDPHDHRCCQHNVSHAWPYFAEHLWAATRDNGLLAAFYCSSVVNAKVGERGSEVSIEEETNYPFEETITFRIVSADNVVFPLLLRVPTWAKNPSLKINGSAQKVDGTRAGFIRIDREWNNGDTVELRLPMEICVKKWPAQNDSQSIEFGPLTFSLRIGEKVQPVGGAEGWPAFEYAPVTSWNYGLPLDAVFELRRKPFAKGKQPFDTENVPIEIVTKGRKISEWQQDYLGLPGLLQKSPAFTQSPLETLTLIPMGAARLRISQFPTVSESADANKWNPPPKLKKSIPAVASFANSNDPVSSLTDGLEPKNSSDDTIPRFTWWNHVGTKEWIELHFSESQTLQEFAVYWFDDRRIGGRCRVPESWNLLYQSDEGEWRPVAASRVFSTATDRYNDVSFAQVTTRKLRIEVQLQNNMSGGILEVKWK